MVGEKMTLILVGLFLGVVLFVLLGSVLYVGYRFGKKKPTNTQEADPDEVKVAEELRKEFLNVMNYDTTKALQRKKV
jgi:hypothetical protein